MFCNIIQKLSLFLADLPSTRNKRSSHLICQSWLPHFKKCYRSLLPATSGYTLDFEGVLATDAKTAI